MSQRNYHRWTIRQDYLIAANYKTNTYIELAKLIGCQPLQVRNRLKKLGIRKPGRKRNVHLNLLFNPQ